MSEVSEHTPHEKLIRMANQIATFFRSQPGQPEIAVAGHINDFWTYRMRMDLLAALRAGEAVSPLQHIWSMSVQGQFYLMAILVGSLCGSHRRCGRRCRPPCS